MLSECEEMCLSIIYQCNEAPDLRAVLESVNKKYGKNWKPQTVSTFLARMIRKGYITSTRRGRYTYYSAAVQKEEYIKSKIENLAKEFANGDVDLLMAQYAAVKSR